MRGGGNGVDENEKEDGEGERRRRRWMRKRAGAMRSSRGGRTLSHFPLLHLKELPMSQFDSLEQEPLFTIRHTRPKKILKRNVEHLQAKPNQTGVAIQHAGSGKVRPAHTRPRGHNVLEDQGLEKEV